MLSHRLRRWPDIKTTLVECLELVIDVVSFHAASQACERKTYSPMSMSTPAYCSEKSDGSNRLPEKSKDTGVCTE